MKMSVVETIAKQIALALRDEVADLEAAGIGIIQIDEPRCAKVYRCVVATGTPISSGA